ncbi:hypothetical protein ES703_76886 [subsurface metagenome]
MNKQRTVRPLLGRTCQQRRETGAVKFYAARSLQSAQLSQRRQHVDMCREPVNVPAARQAAAGPADKARHTVPSIVLRALGSSHAGVITLSLALFPSESCGRSVVGHKDKNSIFFKTQRLQLLHKASNVLINVGYHTVEVGVGNVLIAVWLCILFRHVVRTVRRVCRQVAKERPVLIGFDELQCVIKPHVRTIAAILFLLAVMEVGVVEVVVAPVVYALADPASAVD